MWPRGLGFAQDYRPILWTVILLILAASSLGQTVKLRCDGREYIDLATAGSRFGMDAYWLRGTEIFRLRSKWTRIEVGKGKKLLHLNGMPIYLGFPTLLVNGRLYLSVADYQHVMQSILTPQVFPNPPELKRIVLDPGHGGRDSGAIDPVYGHTEKGLNFDLTIRLQRLLEKAGYDVRLTRATDEYIPLRRRPRIANHLNADLFVSLHFNAAANKSAAGLETFVLTPQFQASSKFSAPTKRDSVRFGGNDYDSWNALLGYHVQKSLVNGVGGPDRGLKRARFMVLKELDCPGVLVELGFVSHRGTANQLRSAKYRQNLAQSLFDGIVDYHQRLEHTR